MDSARRNLLLVFLLLAMFEFSPRAAASRTKEVRRVFVGALVDVTCATDPKKDLGKLRSEHTLKCLLMPICSESGYALLTDEDQVLRFDTRGNKLARN